MKEQFCFGDSGWRKNFKKQWMMPRRYWTLKRFFSSEELQLKRSQLKSFNWKVLGRNHLDLPILHRIRMRGGLRSSGRCSKRLTRFVGQNCWLFERNCCWALSSHKNRVVTLIFKSFQIISITSNSFRNSPKNRNQKYLTKASLLGV